MSYYPFCITVHDPFGDSTVGWPYLTDLWLDRLTFGPSGYPRERDWFIIEWGASSSYVHYYFKEPLPALLLCEVLSDARNFSVSHPALLNVGDF